MYRVYSLVGRLTKQSQQETLLFLCADWAWIKWFRQLAVTSWFTPEHNIPCPRHYHPATNPLCPSCCHLPMMPLSPQALPTRIGTRRGICTPKLLIPGCVAALVMSSLETTCGVCSLRMLQQMGSGQWILLWRFAGGFHGCLDFLPFQHGKDLDAVQAGSISPRRTALSDSDSAVTDKYKRQWKNIKE